MTKYLIEFFLRNKKKSFFTNIKKYNKLNYNDKCKTLSSFLTYLFIHRAEVTEEYYKKQNDKVIIEILSLLTNLVLYKIDNFSDWFLKNFKKRNKNDSDSR